METLLIAFAALTALCPSSHAGGVESAADLAVLVARTENQVVYRGNRTTTYRLLQEILSVAESDAREVRLRHMDAELRLRHLSDKTRGLVYFLERIPNRAGSGDLSAEFLTDVAHIIADSAAAHRGLRHPQAMTPPADAAAGPYREQPPSTTAEASDAITVPASQLPDLFAVAQLAAIHFANIQKIVPDAEELKWESRLNRVYAPLGGVIVSGIITSLGFAIASSFDVSAGPGIWSTSLLYSTALGGLIGSVMAHRANKELKQRAPLNAKLVSAMLTGFYESLSLALTDWGIPAGDWSQIQELLEQKQYTEARNQLCGELLNPAHGRRVQARVAEPDDAETQQEPSSEARQQHKANE